MHTREIITLLALHGIKHKIEENQVFAEDYHIHQGIKKSYWFPVTGATEKELMAFFIFD